MLLEDATDKIQVMRALEAGDEELREDIKEQLEPSISWWNTEGVQTYLGPEDDTDYSTYLATEDFVNAVISDSPSRYDLSTIPRENVEAQLEWNAMHPTIGARPRGNPRWGPFELSYTGGDGFSFQFYQHLVAHFPESWLPWNADLIPPDMAKDFWNDLNGGVTWDQVDRVEENYGHAEGERLFITARRYEFDEWCRDLIAEHVTELIKKDPVAAREAFYKSVESEESALGTKLRAANLPEEELVDLATQWFGDEDDRENALATIREYFATLEGDADVEREVIAEWTQGDLRAMGITKGTLYEEAPWKLIKLRPSDLRLEGALMRHCVGDSGMGYIRAVKDGEVEIWSLRSRANKPRFTLEVDGSFYDVVPRPEFARGEAIKQLKGKANRLPGFADSRSVDLKFPDEIRFWKAAFEQMMIRPYHVEDFAHAEGLWYDVRPNADACTGFDMPYRPLRSRRKALRRRTSR
jgi:hypothetical protein